MRLAAGAFIAGAASRLLPPSIPFRFFGAAVAYQLLAWIALFVGAQGVPRFSGGLGWPLAALHLVTLGVLVMTAIGASLQLLPVATRRPVPSKWWPALIWWLYTPGVAAVAVGMGVPAPPLLAGGAIAVLAALGGFAWILARNLVGARGMPVVVAHGWAALGSLVVVLATALSLVCAYMGFSGFGRGMSLALHLTFAAYGFMGLLALGLSYILVPMFALSSAPNERRAAMSLTFAVTALLLSAAASSGIAEQPLRIAAIGVGTAAVALHLRLMGVALKSGMRRELGRSFTLIRIAWVSLVASLAAALGVTLDVPIGGMDTLFGLLLIVGWLLTFLVGILQRIIPFLASMHSAPGGRLAPTPSSLTAQRPLAIQFVCHLAALLLLGLAALFDSERFVSAGAIVGSVGAAAFVGFFLIVLRRMSTPRPKAERR
jgi:hypothetical protein